MSRCAAPRSARAAARSGRLRRWSILTALAVLAAGVGARPAGAQCIGDCNADGAVAINELILGVNIALGSAPVGSCQTFANAQGAVDIAQLVTGVNNALFGCPGTPAATESPVPTGTATVTSMPMITLTGSCAVPGHGPHGLKLCDAGTPITVFRCDDRAGCLHDEGLTRLGATTVASDGGWSVQVALADAGAALIFQASITQAVVFRTLSFGIVGNPLRAGQARGVIYAPVDITPVTEAAVVLLDQNGFENYSDTGARQVMSAVEQATADLSFETETPATAAALALQTASNDPAVIMVLQTARNTPTPTSTPVGADTPTASPTVPPQPGAIVIFDNLQVDASHDPLLTLANASQFPVYAYCFYADRTQPACKTAGFNVFLAAFGSIQWQASAGGPVPGTGMPFTGELACVEVDLQDSPIDRNDLTGEASIGALDRDAIAIEAGSEINDGDLTLVLGGPFAEYGACPAGIDADRMQTCWSQSQLAFVCGAAHTPTATPTPTPTIAGAPTRTVVPLDGPSTVSAYVPGSLLVYPYLAIDTASGTDTVVQLSNTSDAPLAVRCFYENTTAHCSNQPLLACNASLDCPAGGVCDPGWSQNDFEINLIGLQPISWRISQGLAGSIPAAPESPFVGVLRCLVIDDTGVAVGDNALTGEAAIEHFIPGSQLDVARYNALSVPALTTGNGDQTLALGDEYAGCPYGVIFNPFLDGAADPALEGSTVRTTLALVPCSADYLREQPATVAVKYLVFNEFEQSFSIGNGPFQAQLVSPLADISRVLTASVAGTLTAQVRINGVEGGVLGVAIEAHAGAAASHSTGLNAYGFGLRQFPDPVTVP